MSAFLAAAAGVMGAMMAGAPLLQLRVILRERHSEEVSLGFLVVILIGNLSWSAYGFDIGNLVIMIPNSLGMLCSGSAAWATWYFRNGDPRASR